tara:strand:+ start:427 stop:699 length:273 start_codon:yes stop_codon:yes gene_type:complete
MNSVVITLGDMNFEVIIEDASEQFSTIEGTFFNIKDILIDGKTAPDEVLNLRMNRSKETLREFLSKSAIRRVSKGINIGLKTTYMSFKEL